MTVITENCNKDRLACFSAPEEPPASARMPVFQYKAFSVQKNEPVNVDRSAHLGAQAFSKKAKAKSQELNRWENHERCFENEIFADYCLYQKQFESFRHLEKSGLAQAV